MNLSADGAVIDSPDFVAPMTYVSRASRICRRYFGPGFEVDTSIKESRDVALYNGRRANPQLDTNGFTLLKHHSTVDLYAFANSLEAGKLYNGLDVCGHPYAAEVRAAIQRVTGAALVLDLNCIARTSGATVGSRQPPADGVHVDMNGADAARNAEYAFELHGRPKRPYSRFLITSFWRPISPPPQDIPLALCDAQTVDEDEGVNNYFVFADQPPDLDNLPLELLADESTPAGNVFYFSPRHRWYYFPEMSADEVVLLKLHDSDHRRAWRSPHTAVLNPGVSVAHPRESIEFRTVAYFE
jgi:hypothetical protein